MASLKPIVLCLEEGIIIAYIICLFELDAENVEKCIPRISGSWKSFLQVLTQGVEGQNEAPRCYRLPTTVRNLPQHIRRGTHLRALCENFLRITQYYIRRE